MHKITCDIDFCYGHRLIRYEGKCARLHGHNARVQIELSSAKLNAQGMVMDFHDVRETIGKWIKETIDHRLLLAEEDTLVPVLAKVNEPFVTMKENPTAEAIAKWIYEEARKRRLPVSKVTLWETPDNSAVYHE